MTLDTATTLAHIYAASQMDMRLAKLKIDGDDEVWAISWRAGCE